MAQSSEFGMIAEEQSYFDATATARYQQCTRVPDAADSSGVLA